MISKVEKTASQTAVCFRCGGRFEVGDPFIVKHGKMGVVKLAGPEGEGDMGSVQEDSSVQPVEFAIAFHPHCATEWMLGLGFDLYVAKKSGVDVMSAPSSMPYLSLAGLSLGTGDAPKGTGGE